MFSNRVEIILDSILGRKVLKDDPIGYDSSEMKIGRSEKTHGIFIEQINNLEFTGAAKKYLEQLYALKGPQAKCRLVRKEKHPTTDDWKLHSDGFLDFTSRKIKDNKLSLDFVEGGLREILVSQLREKFELNRTTDINGKEISSLNSETLSIKGREIYLASKLRSDSTEFDIKSGKWASTMDLREAYKPMPFSVLANSDPENINTPIAGINSKGGGTYDPEAGSFFLVANRNLGRVELKIKASFRIASIDSDDVNAYENMQVRLYRYSDRDQFNVMPGYPIILADIGNPFNAIGQTINIDENFIFDQVSSVKEGESLAVYLYTAAAYGDTSTGNTGYMNVNVDRYSGVLDWNEDSFYPRTNAKCLTAFETGKRLSEIYTGKPCFDSHLLEGKDPVLLKDTNHQIVYSPGGWLRNLQKEEEDETGNTVTKEWPFEMSFEDFYKSQFALMPVGYGIAIHGNQQKIIFEDLRFFFQRQVLVNLGKIDVKERTTAVEYCYQSLKFGYLKGGNYEKPLGLDEYNTQTATRTPLTVTDNEYEALGPSRTDSYGAEDARRKQGKDYPDEDTPYDRDNFMFDVKTVQKGVYEVRTWSDDFEVAPSGVYSPDTAFNLNFSPGRNRQRHAYWFNNAIVKLRDQAIQFLNSQGNSSLKTKKTGESALKENQASIPIPELANPLFEPEWIQAERSFSQDILDQITGTTIIKGREVNNYYGLAEFINEKNRTERAFIFSVKIKDKFTFKLLKAYGI